MGCALLRVGRLMHSALRPVLCAVLLLGLSSTASRAQEAGIREVPDAELLHLFEAPGTMCYLALQETIRRGPRMVPHLLALRGDERVYHGGNLVPTTSSTIVSSVPGSDEFSRRHTVTFELLGLYLIDAIYHGRLYFANGPFLADDTLPPTRRQASNDKALIDRGWESVEHWRVLLESEGLEALRKKHMGPLDGARVSFW
jgi:hypothetical protein